MHKLLSRRLKAMGQAKYKDGFDVVMHEECLTEPVKWSGSHNVFVCSMSDLFHERVTFDFIDKIMDTIKATPNNRYQLLTKRAERMSEYFSMREVPRNVWLGVTVEMQKAMERIDYLRKMDASVRFISCEPLIEDLGAIDLTGIDWVIVGGESGARARPMKAEWVASIKEQTEAQGAAFFFKQWGTRVQVAQDRHERSSSAFMGERRHKAQ